MSRSKAESVSKLLFSYKQFTHNFIWNSIILHFDLQFVFKTFFVHDKKQNVLFMELEHMHRMCENFVREIYLRSNVSYNYIYSFADIPMQVITFQGIYLYL